jgi:hypothetical protein
MLLWWAIYLVHNDGLKRQERTRGAVQVIGREAWKPPPPKFDSKAVAGEIIASLKGEESEIFERAAEYAYMYYANIIKEIKANSHVEQANHEVSLHFASLSERIAQIESSLATVVQQTQRTPRKK